MRSGAKSNGKKKQAKDSDVAAENLEKKMKVMSDGAANKKSISKSEVVISAASDRESDHGDREKSLIHNINNGLYTLRYDINDKGIGQILLPPSLSMLLQSDRVCISPAAGGLFIKSI